MGSLLRRAAIAGLLLGPVAALAADEHWGYTYKGIDVTVDGNGALAVNLARYCVRLDAMLTKILGIGTNYRVPTRLYALPGAQIKRLAGGDYESAYLDSSYDNTVLMDSSSNPEGRRYWGAFFGYTATLLASDKLLRGPGWYMIGVPSVFADTVFEGSHVKLGNITPGFADTLTNGGSLIPMRTFLTMKQHDAMLKGKRDLEMFDAESWFLARLVFVEGHHRSEFGRYLDLMRAGKSEPEAFSASFRISYEDLDKEIQLAMHERAHVYIMDTPPDPLPKTEGAQRLSAAEFKARLAQAYGDYGHAAAAIDLANEALREEPDNQRALRALARAQLDAHAYPEALAAVDRMGGHEQSAAGYADRAAVLAALAQVAARGEAQLPVDAVTLRRRAKEDYERALAADGEDRRSRDALAGLAAPP